MAIEDRARARLRQARFERGLTVAQVAERTGMTASTVSRLETGARRLTLAHLERLAPVLQRSVDALVADDATPVPAHDGRIWSPVGPERLDGPHVYRVVLPVEPPAPHQHEGHQWVHMLAGTARLRVGDTERVLHTGDTAEFSTWEPHALAAVGSPAEALIIFRPSTSHGPQPAEP